MRLFTTPKIPSKYSPSGSAKCWRERAEHQANLAHVLLLPSVENILMAVRGKATKMFHFKKAITTISILHEAASH